MVFAFELLVHIKHLKENFAQLEGDILFMFLFVVLYTLLWPLTGSEKEREKEREVWVG